MTIKKISGKILSILVIFSLLLMVLPITVFEVEAVTNYPTTIAGTQITDENINSLPSGVTYTPADTATSTPAKLTLNGVDISGDYIGGVIDTSEDLEIVLVGENTLTNTETGIKSTAILTFSGDGSLSVTGGDVGGTGIYGSVTVKDSASVTATGGENAVDFGGSGIEGSVTVKDSASVTATGGNSDSGMGGHGIYGSVIVDGDSAKLTAQGGNGTSGRGGNGINIEQIFTLSGKNANVTAIGGNGTSNGQGLLFDGDTFTMSNGTLTAVGGDVISGYSADGVGFWLSISEKVNITGGNITAIGGTYNNDTDSAAFSDKPTLGSGSLIKTADSFSENNGVYTLVSPTTVQESSDYHLAKAVNISFPTVYNTTIAGTQITSDNINSLPTGVTYTPADIATGTPAKLTLNNVNITGDYSNGVINTTENLEIVLVGDNNTLTNEKGSQNGIFSSNKDLTFSGSGSLSVTGDDSTNYGGHGIYGSVTVDGSANVTAIGGSPTNGDGGDGIYGSVTVDGDNAKLTAQGGNPTIGDGGDGIIGSVTVNGDNAKLTAQGGDGTSGSGGIGIEGSVTVNGDNAKLTVQGGDGSYGGIGIYALNGSVTGENASITAIGGDGNFGGYGILLYGELEVTAGTLTAVGGTMSSTDSTDGVGIYADSSATININGGNVTLIGGTHNNGTDSAAFYSSDNTKPTLGSDMVVQTATGFSESNGVYTLDNPNTITDLTTDYYTAKAVNINFPVTNITMTNANTVQVNNDLALSGTVEPANATNQNIVWTVKNENGTGATVINGIFKATTAGTATVTATIIDGTAVGTNFTKDFDITIIGESTPPTTTTGTPAPTYSPDDLAELEPKNGDKITIEADKNGDLTISKEFLEEIAGKDVEVTIETESGNKWYFNGKEIPTDVDLSDIVFGVTTTNGITDNINSENISFLLADGSVVTLNVFHDGEFGFPVNLQLHLGYSLVGKYANIYYYNEETQQAEFVGSYPINEAGNAHIQFTHASYYLVQISDTEGLKVDITSPTATAPVQTTEVTTDTENEDENPPKTGSTIPAISLVTVVLASGLILTAKKKR